MKRYLIIDDVGLTTESSTLQPLFERVRFLVEANVAANSEATVRVHDDVNDIVVEFLIKDSGE